MSQTGTVPKNHYLGPKTCKNRDVQSLEELVRRRVVTLYEKPSRNGDRWTADRLAPFLGMKDPSGVRKLLNGDNKISLAHVQGFCEAFQVTPSELVSPDGALFTYLKESEPTLLKLFREMDAHERHSLMNVLQWRLPVTSAGHRRARRGRAELTSEQQTLVDLFVRSEPQTRAGVMKILHGAAKEAHRGDLADDGNGSRQ